MTRRNQAAVCSNCGANARIVHDAYRFKESGLKQVVLMNIAQVRCEKCNNCNAPRYSPVIASR